MTLTKTELREERQRSEARLATELGELDRRGKLPRRGIINERGVYEPAPLEIREICEIIQTKRRQMMAEPSL